MKNDDRFVVNSQDTLYLLPNSSCSEGDTVNLSNQTVLRYRLVNGEYISADYTTLGAYSTTTYICHVYNDKMRFDTNFLILPAVIIMLAFFSVIYHWFLRLRG